MFDHICVMLRLITPGNPFDKRVCKVLKNLYLGTYRHLLMTSAIYRDSKKGTCFENDIGT